MRISFEIPDPKPAPEAQVESAPKKAATPAPAQRKNGSSAERVASGVPGAKATAAEPTPKAELESARTTLEKQPPPTAPEVRSASSPVAKTPQKPSEAKPSEPSVVSTTNPLHSFDLQGGTNNISDPDADNPNVYRFVAPKGEA